MSLSCHIFSIILIFIFIVYSSSSSSSSSICSDNDACECEETSTNGQIYLSLKCANLPKFQSNVHYRTIEFESCSEDLNFQSQPFNQIHLNILRIRHCNLIHLDEQSFAHIHQFEKFYLENSTIKSSNGNFQEIFSANSFQTLKSLSLRTIHYHHHDKKLNLEYLLQQLPHLNRLEFSHIHLDNYHAEQQPIQSIGQDLTYLSLTNTHQTHLIPIEIFSSLESLLIRHLPDVFHTQPLISSLGKLKHLKYILFEHNQLKSLDDLSSNSIDDIDLSSNLLTSIDGYTFEHVPKLRQLTLTGNPLETIDRNAFCGIDHLQRLSIHNKYRLNSPLNNCLLIDSPHLQIIQDSQTKFPCDCQLLHVFHMKRQSTNEINRLFKFNQVCRLGNQTMNLYELVHALNCSTNNPCSHVCQEKKRKMSSTTYQINPKYYSSSSVSSSLYAFFSSQLCALLVAVWYL